MRVVASRVSLYVSDMVLYRGIPDVVKTDKKCIKIIIRLPTL